MATQSKTATRSKVAVKTKTATKKPVVRKSVAKPAPRPVYVPVDEIAVYIAAAAESRRAVLEQLRSMIHRAAPHANESMVYRMPTYLEGDKFCAFANQKSHVSVYLCDAKVAAGVRSRNPQVKGGKTCLNFIDGSEIPFADIERAIKMLFA